MLRLYKTRVLMKEASTMQTPHFPPCSNNSRLLRRSPKYLDNILHEQACQTPIMEVAVLLIERISSKPLQSRLSLLSSSLISRPTTTSQR